MDQDRLEGAARNAGGALEEEFGRATGDTKTPRTPQLIRSRLRASVPDRLTTLFARR